MKFDLHVHTNYSDGRFSPNKVVDLAVGKGLDGIAITDHETVSGVQKAIEHGEKHSNFNVIPGLELGCIYDDDEVHILGYFIDHTSKELLYTTKLLRQDRNKRGQKIIQKLNRLNININKKEVQNLSKGDFIGRVDIARILVVKDYVSSISEAFEKYLNKDAPAYVLRKTLTIKESIKLINKANGVAVLAHPGILKEKEKIINYCIKNGIQGIECIHSKHSKSDIQTFKDIAIKNNLLITGGSDCHGEVVNNDLLLGRFYVGRKEIFKIKELI